MIVLGGAWLELQEQRPAIIRALEALDEALRNGLPEFRLDQLRQAAAREILDGLESSYHSGGEDHEF